MDLEFERRWQATLQAFEQHFGGGMDLQAMLFVIGLQELGLGPLELKKQEKMEVFHIAVCTVLEPYGFYRLSHRDEHRWPHFERVRELPPLSEKEQQRLLRAAVIEYAEKMGLVFAA